MTRPSLVQLNHNAASIASAAAMDPALGIEAVSEHQGVSYRGARVLNFARKSLGTINAGLKLAEISMAGLGQVSVSPSDSSVGPALPRINVATGHPLLACMASQYAGWPLSLGGLHAMCSGPARCLRGREQLLEQYDLVHTANVATGVLEISGLPPVAMVEEFAKQCSVEMANVTICVAPTASLAGTIGVVSRSVETAMHKLHELGFDLTMVKQGHGWGPLPPIAPDDLTALGWTNDAILYGTTVHLDVDTTDASIEKIIDAIPSQSSADFGSPFLDIFNRYGGDFYKVDPLLFSPAEIVINNLQTGRRFHAGEIREDILQQSFPLCPSPTDGQA